MPDDDRKLAVPDPDVIRVSADDVLTPAEVLEQVEQVYQDLRDGARQMQQSLMRLLNTDEDALVYGNLRTPEADAPPSSGHDPAMARAIQREILWTKDPSLRRALLEEFHR